MDARHNAHTSKNASTSEGSKNSVDVVKHGQSDKDTKTHPSVQESEGEDQQDAGFECPVCLQTASFPVQLPCRHIFCFLCVKGAANRSKRCAMCRQEIPADFFNDPKLLHSEEVSEKSKTIFDEGYQWFYEGRNGWWQYDERTSLELENKYKAGERTFELLIAGFLYVIDLENMRQFRRNDQTRRRKMKRDMCDIPDIKGIAGIKYNESQHMLRPSGDGGEARKSSGNVNPIPNSTPSLTQSVSAPSVINNRGPIGGQDDSFVGPSAPNNTPQAPMTPADSQSSSLANSQEDLSLHLQNLHLFHPSVRRVRSRPESPSTAYPPPWYDEDEEDRRAPSPPPDYGRDEGLEGYSGEISADAVGEGDGTDEDTGEYSADDADNISSPNREVKETRL